MRSIIGFTRSVTVLLQASHYGIRKSNKFAPFNSPLKLWYHESKHESDSSFKEGEADSTTTSSSSEKDECHEEELCSKVLSASLPFVKEYGWTSETIAKGAESLGYSRMVHGMFDKGGVELINYFYSDCNLRLENELEKLTKDENKTKNTTEFIRSAVELRLRMNIEYIDTWAKALALYSSPNNLRTSLTSIGTMVDTMWYYAGDKSHDFNWYTKRGILAAIYKSTELCMLQDQSHDFQDTWHFLDRRMKDTASLVKCVKETEQKAKDVATLMEVGFITLQNILGMNNYRMK